VTSETEILIPEDETVVGDYSKKSKAKSKLNKLEDEARKDWHKAEEEGSYLWNVLKEQLFRPGVAGGLIGVGTFFSNLASLIC
jgi:hypothetical protein